MLTQQRKRLILDLLARDGQVVAKTMSLELGLSEDTIRRDMRELAAEGLIQRVHGGALPASPTIADISARRSMSASEKTRLGKRAAALIQKGQTVMFDGGTTNLEIVRHLGPSVAFTAITHSPTIAVELERHPQVDVLLIGGRLFRHSMVATGALAIEGISRLRADLLFLGITGVHAVEGLTTGDAEEAAVKRALLARASETIVVATAEKIGAVSPCLVSPLADIATIIVAAGVPEERMVPIEREGLSIIRAT